MSSLWHHDHSMDEEAIGDESDDDQLSVPSSSRSSVFSTPDGASFGSQCTTDQLLSAEDEFVDLLADDELLKPLYGAAIDNEIIGGDRFEKNFGRLLELCSEELEKEAQEQLQLHVVRLVRTRAAYISKRLRDMHNDPEHDNIAKDMRKLGNQSIERWGPESVEQVKSSTNLPATEPHISISPTSPDTSTSTLPGVSCRAGSRHFKGSAQDAESNLLRHLRESRRHNRSAGLKCPLPECAMRYHMRPDNLGPHLLKVHRISSKSERQSIIQASRLGLKYELQQVIEEAGEDDGVSTDIEHELGPLSGLIDLPNLKTWEEFVLSSNAFKNLRTNFEQFVQPEIAMVFPDIAQQVHITQNNVLPGMYPETYKTASSRIHKALSVQATKMQALYTSIKCRLVQLSSLYWSLGSGMLERHVRRWEPLKDQDKVRIRWRCRCVSMLWDDFRELRPGAAEDLRASLNLYESTMNGQGTDNLQQSPIPYSLGGNAAGSVASMPVFSYAVAPGQSSTVDAAEGGIMTTEPPPSTLPCLEAKYLLLCFRKSRDTLRLYHLSVENIKNDFQPFQLLQQTYQAYRGLSGRLFSPQKVKSIAFRKLERHPRERVVIRSSPDIVPSRTNPEVCHKEHVPKCDTEYDIHPVPPDLDPYLGRNGLEHLLNYPHEAEEQGNNLPIQDVWLQRFPKKERSKLIACPRYQYGLGWGVEFEEAWNLSWILRITLLGCVLPATVFLVCWWSIRGDVQGATGMAALLISYCVLLITLISGFAVA